MASSAEHEAQWWTLRKDWINPSATLTPSYVPFWRIDVSLPWVYAVLKALGALASPLVYLAIGLTLGEKSIKEAAANRLAWLFAFFRIFVGPLLVLGILYALEGIAKACAYPQLISLATVQSTILMWAVPPVTVGVAYCLEFDNEKNLASDASLLSTILFIPGVVVFTLLLTVIENSGFFFA